MRIAVVGVVLLGLVAACGQPAENAEAPATSTRPESSAEAEPPGEENPAKALKAAIRTLAKDSTGSYRSKVTFGEGVAILEEGVYDLRRQSSRSLMSIVSKPDAVDLAFASIRERKQVWLRFDKTGFVEGSTCWMHMRADSLQELQRLGDAQADFGLPAAVSVALQGKGETWEETGEVLRGSTDLFTLATTVGKMTTKLEMDIESTDRVEVDFVLEDGRLVGWESSLPTLFDAVERAGVNVPDEGAGPATEGDFPMTATFARAGEPVSIERPDPTKVIDFDPTQMTEQEFEAELEACEAR